MRMEIDYLETKENSSEKVLKAYTCGVSTESAYFAEKSREGNGAEKNKD